MPRPRASFCDGFQAACAAAIHRGGCGGRHMCMVMRGVQKTTSVTATSHMMGVFKTDTAVRDEFYAMLRK